MRIHRLEVSGGFLDGLRLSLADGLNVLIGPRGAGKTSVLELIRYALGVPAMTDDASIAASMQARAVLADGTVTAYCSTQGEELVFSRTGLDESPSASARYRYTPPLIVSQNEIEAIGLSPSSRREILDRLIDPLAWDELDTAETRGTIASFERRLERLRAEREEYVERAEQVEGLADQLAEAEAEQKTASRAVKKAKPLQEAIAKRADQLGQIRAAADAYKIAEETLAAWKNELKEATLGRPLPKLPSAAVEAQVEAAASKARELLEEAVRELGVGQKLVADARAESRSGQAAIQAELKGQAEKLEELQRGAGDVGRRVSALRQQLKERDGLLKRVAELDAEIMRVVGERDQALDEAETQAQQRYELRKKRAADLASQFHGRIEVRVDKSGEFAAYEAALATALQGSNLQYKALARSLASKVSPRELVTAVEAADAGRIVNAGKISSDRAVRLVAHLRQQSVVDLLLAPLDDSVDFALLDGQDYKPTRDLSMGQRCTVVLPLLLAEARDAVLLDQPEDHLDNAFVVETLVEAVRERARDGQVIVATHNANIPVLGEARQVIVLASDGRHGFVTTAAELDDEQSVSAITTLMEGGREAFEQRAAFYHAHPDD